MLISVRTDRQTAVYSREVLIRETASKQFRSWIIIIIIIIIIIMSQCCGIKQYTQTEKLQQIGQI